MEDSDSSGFGSVTEHQDGPSSESDTEAVHQEEHEFHRLFLKEDFSAVKDKKKEEDKKRGEDEEKEEEKDKEKKEITNKFNEKLITFNEEKNKTKNENLSNLTEVSKLVGSEKHKKIKTGISNKRLEPSSPNEEFPPYKKRKGSLFGKGLEKSKYCKIKSVAVPKKGKKRCLEAATENEEPPSKKPDVFDFTKFIENLLEPGPSTCLSSKIKNPLEPGPSTCLSSKIKTAPAHSLDSSGNHAPPNSPESLTSSYSDDEKSEEKQLSTGVATQQIGRWQSTDPKKKTHSSIAQSTLENIPEEWLSYEDIWKKTGNLEKTDA